MKKILMIVLALTSFAQLFSGVTVYNKTPYNIKVNMWWHGARGGNNLKNPLYVGPGQNKKMTGDSWDLKSKYRAAANVYGNDYTDMITERSAGGQSAGNQTIDVVVAYKPDGTTGLSINGHTK